MPVIGRLDDQVEAVLINPLKRRPMTEEAEREQPAVPASGSEERDNADTPSERRDNADASTEKREAKSALPVWLL